MGESVTQEDLSKWAGLAEQATPGPWLLDSHAHPTKHCRCLSCYQTSTVWQPGGMDCDDVARDDNNLEDDGDRCNQFGYTYDDAEFIAAARTAVPALLAEVERLRVKLDAVRDRASDWVDYGQDRSASGTDYVLADAGARLIALIDEAA